MKRKIGTIIDEGLILRAKQAALSQEITLSALLEDALREYFQRREVGHEREKISDATRGILKIEKSILEKIMEEDDVYES